MPIFSIPDDIHFFNFAGMSPLPIRTQQVGQKAVLVKAEPWTMNVNEKFFSDLDQARSLFAKLVGANAEDIALIPSATYGVTVAAQQMSLQADDEILLQHEEFPALYYPFAKLAEKQQAKIILAHKSEGQNWTTAVLSKINAKTRVVAISPCHWVDGATIDLEQIRKACRQFGAKLVIDGCQWVGANEFNVQEIDPDFLIVPTYKWMLGPYQFGFMYVAPRNQNGVPLEEYWANRDGAQNFVSLTDYTNNYQPGARRFDMSERSNLITVPMAKESVEILLELGPKNIANKIADFTNEIASFATSLGLDVPGKEERSKHFIGLRTKSNWKVGLGERLISKKIFASIRGNCLRIAPHVETTERDLRALFDFLKAETSDL